MASLSKVMLYLTPCRHYLRVSLLLLLLLLLLLKEQQQNIDCWSLLYVVLLLCSCIDCLARLLLFNHFRTYNTNAIHQHIPAPINPKMMSSSHLSPDDYDDDVATTACIPDDKIIHEHIRSSSVAINSNALIILVLVAWVIYRKCRQLHRQSLLS